MDEKQFWMTVFLAQFEYEGETVASAKAAADLALKGFREAFEKDKES